MQAGTPSSRPSMPCGQKQLELRSLQDLEQFFSLCLEGQSLFQDSYNPWLVPQGRTTRPDLHLCCLYRGPRLIRIGSLRSKIPRNFKKMPFSNKAETTEIRETLHCSSPLPSFLQTVLEETARSAPGLSFLFTGFVSSPEQDLKMPLLGNATCLPRPMWVSTIMDWLSNQKLKSTLPPVSQKLHVLFVRGFLCLQFES